MSMRAPSFFILLLASVPARAADDTLAMVKHDSDIQAAVEKWKPLADLMAGEIGRKGVVLASANVGKLTSAIASGKAHTFVDTPFSRAVLDPERKLIPVATYWKKGKEEYAGCLYVPKDSAIKNIADLKGKKVVFEDPLSTGSFALPMSLVLKENLKTQLIDLKAAGGNELDALKKAAVAADAMGFAFTWDDKTSEAWVKAGAADALGAACGGIEGDMRELGKSPQVPRAIVAIHKDVPAEQREKIVAKLTSLKGDHPALTAGDKASKVEAIKKAHLDALESLSALFGKVAETIKPLIAQ